jgi:1,4-alpha-glucan branching enzyme
MESHKPQDGDVLVSNPTATVEHEICISPRPPHITCANHDQAVATGRQLAERLKVDAWLTEDYRHFLRIGTYRQ